MKSPLDSGVLVAINEFRVTTAESGDIDDGDIVLLLRRVREVLGMDIIFVGEFSGGAQVLHHVDLGYEDDQRLDGLSTDLSDTYCQLMIESRIPQSVPDVTQFETLANRRSTRELGIASYLSVPVVAPDGTLYGTLCCLSHSQRPGLNVLHERSLGEVAQLLTGTIERNRKLRERRQLSSPNLSA